MKYNGCSLQSELVPSRSSQKALNFELVAPSPIPVTFIYTKLKLSVYILCQCLFPAQFVIIRYSEKLFLFYHPSNLISNFQLPCKLTCIRKYFVGLALYCTTCLLMISKTIKKSLLDSPFHFISH